MTEPAPLVDQLSKAPTRKVKAGALGAAGLGLPVTQLLLLALGAAGIELPADVASAIATLITAGAGFASAYFARERAAA